MWRRLETIGHAELVSSKLCVANGFSWSSFVSRSTMIGVCEDARLPRSELISANRDTLDDFGRVHAIATDDVMLISHPTNATRRNHFSKYLIFLI